MKTKPSLPTIDITIEDARWETIEDIGNLVEHAVGAAICEASLDFADEAELSVLFASDTVVQNMNRQWRQIDRPTNVLSFPGDDILPGESAGLMIGDIVLAFDTVAAEADGHEIDIKHHICHLIIHGFLHLFGYDHLNDHDAEHMEQLERKALARMGIDDPYRDSEPLGA